MDALQFVYWLQGYVELNGESPTPEQWQSIKEHLQLVFLKVTAPVAPPAVMNPPNLPDFTKVTLAPMRPPYTSTCLAVC